MLIAAAVAAGLLGVLLLTLIHGAGFKYLDNVMRDPYLPWMLACWFTIPVYFFDDWDFKSTLIVDAALYFLILAWKYLEGLVLKQERDIQGGRRGR